MREKIIEMEEYAKEHNVPIIEKESIAFIMKFIIEKMIFESIINSLLKTYMEFRGSKA